MTLSQFTLVAGQEDYFFFFTFLFSLVFVQKKQQQNKTSANKKIACGSKRFPSWRHFTAFRKPAHLIIWPTEVPLSASCFNWKVRASCGRCRWRRDLDGGLASHNESRRRLSRDELGLGLTNGLRRRCVCRDPKQRGSMALVRSPICPTKCPLGRPPITLTRTGGQTNGQFVRLMGRSSQ